ncbi:MAG: hypothetical protein NUV47_01175 [Patescibacteria group bacterium]|nr:hypothetical protein [Patescibacteria group bacterium]
MNKITIKQFGKDHWSLLLYIETRIHDYEGVLGIYQMRIKNPTIRPGWKPEYGTRLFGYWNKDKTTNSLLQLHNHDDYDCLDDLEAEGLIENIGTRLRPVCIVTEKGTKILSQLLLHKQAGKNYSDFIPNKKEITIETIPDTKS